METGETFTLAPHLRDEAPTFICQLTYASTQVLRFHLKDGDREMTVQKIIFPKTRFAWKLTGSNFQFTGEHAGENINLIFRALDEYMKDAPSWEEYWKGKKG